MNSDQRTKRPPRSGRFCLACFKVTSFEYDRVRGHSVCRECGGFKATGPETAHYIIKETKRRVRENDKQENTK